MIAYLIHTGVSPNSRIGGMFIGSDSGTRNEAHTQIKSSRTTMMRQIGSHKVRTTLGSPHAFEISLSDGVVIGILRHEEWYNGKRLAWEMRNEMLVEGARLDGDS